MEKSLRTAHSFAAPLEKRAAHYLHAAAFAAPRLGRASSPTDATRIYDAACAELTVLLRTGDGGRLWNQPLTLTAHGHTYRLHLQPGNKDGGWAPDYFTSFQLSGNLDKKRVKTPNRRGGLGGALVGVRKLTPRQEFAPKVGISAAVTATLDFQGQDVTLTLRDPTKQTTAQIAGVAHPLAADFSAALCYYPPINQFWNGLIEGLRPGWFKDKTGVFLLQPYDPKRIPVIYVHGLISTPYIWVDPINQIDQDPVLRTRYQPLVFAYPTGNPAAYSALEFRRQLASFSQRYPMPQGLVLISHSLGGVVSQMQSTTLTRADWERKVGPLAAELFDGEAPDSDVVQSLLFQTNPQVKRVVFISAPHQGANMALSRIGELSNALIRLPSTLIGTVNEPLANALGKISGNPHRLPTGVSSLSPKNPTLQTLATTQVVPPCHSIIGNRGLPGPLTESSDGIVPYWSSHLSYAQSEVIVPGPHSCYDYPEAIQELKRILHLHLGQKNLRR